MKLSFVSVMILLGLFSGCDKSQPPIDPYCIHHDQPSWGPGSLIVFVDSGIIFEGNDGTVEVDPEKAGIWTIDSQTKIRKKLFDRGGHPAWSPDGQKIVFSSDGKFLVVDLDGQLIGEYNVPIRSRSPNWTSNGEGILFDSDFSNGTSRALWLLDIETENISLIAGSEGEFFVNPISIDDSSRVACIKYQDHRDVDLFFVGGVGDEVRHTETENYKESLGASSDGQYLSFWERSGPTSSSINVVSVRSSEILKSIDGHVDSPSLNNDGSKIVFVEFDSDFYADDNGVLWIEDINSGSRTQLTTKW